MSADTPTSNPIYTTPQHRLLYEHDRCCLYEAASHRGGFIIGRTLCCPIYQIFNIAVKHTYHLERALRSRPRLRDSLSHMTYIRGKDTALTTTRYLFMTLREHSAQDISSLLNSLRSQHSHLISTGPLIGDPNTDHPQPPSDTRPASPRTYLKYPIMTALPCESTPNNSAAACTIHPSCNYMALIGHQA